MSVCPKCGQEMKEGIVENLRGPVTWYPKEIQNTFFKRCTYPWTADSAVRQLGEHSFLTAGTVCAWFCARCNMVVIFDIRNPK